MKTLTPLQRILLSGLVVGIIGTAAFFAACNPVAQTGQGGGAQSQPQASKPDAAQAAARIWPMYGGTFGRNMVNTTERNLPTKWDIKTGENIKWVAKLGSQSYGNPVFAGGKIYLGTNNASAMNPRDRRKGGDAEGEGIGEDKGILMCLDEASGKFLWQAVHDKLESGRVNDWPYQGVCSSPFVEGDRLFYVSNRCELVCADADGFANGNQGITDEKYKDPTDADIIWKLNMMDELGVFPHNLAVCSPLVIGDLVFIVTGNGHDESHENIPSPRAPSFIAVDKKTGKVAWEDNSPGEKILHGQWSNPCFAEINGRPQVIFPGGDGWLRALEPKTGKLIWKFDCNPKASKYILGGRGTRNEIIATPIVADNKVYIEVGQDPEHGEGVGHLWCIDPSKASASNVDLSSVNDNFDPKAPENQNSGLVWHFGGLDNKGDMIFRRGISTCAVHDGLCYAANLSGFIHCLDAQTGKELWQHDTLADIWGSPYVVDGKVYVGLGNSSVLVFQAGKEQKLLAKNRMDALVYSTPVAVNGVLYVMSRSNLYAIANK